MKHLMNYLSRFVNRFHLKHSLLVVTIAMAIVPLLFSDLLLISISQRNLLENQKQTHRTLSRLIAAQARQFMNVVDSKVESVKTTILFNSIDRELGEIIPLLERRKTLVSFLENAPEIDYVLIQSDSGARTFGLNIGYDAQQVLDRALSPLITTCIHENREIRSAPTNLRDIFKIYLFFLYPVETETERGVIAVAVNMELLFNSIDVELPEGYDYYMVGDDGSILGSNQKALVGFPFYDDMDAIISQRVSIIAHNRDEIIVSGSRISEFQTSVVTFIPISLAYAHVREMKFKTIGFGLLTIILALLAGIVMSTAIHEPLSVLTQATEQIAKRNFSIRVEMEGNSELNLLAKRTNFMLSEIERYVRQLEGLIRYNKEMFISTISALAAAIDAKDEYTRGHSERVTNYAMEIGKAYGLNGVEMERLRIAGLLHDIGKIGVDDKVLRKPGILTEAEFEHMKLHPAIGGRILDPIKELKEIVKGVKYHHEKWDGSGYPEGLKAEEIPVIARIIAIADTFDAMTTNRPYQNAMKPDYVKEKIKGFAGTRYDPDIIQAFVRSYEAGHIQPAG